MMPKLWKARLGEVSDDAEGPDLTLAHKELEGAIGGIFGIPDKVEISEAVFSNPDVASPVTSSGEVFMMRYKSQQATSNARSASGIEFYDGDERKRLVFVNSKIQIFKQLADDSWENVIDLELVEEPTIVEYEDVQFQTLVTGDVGKAIAVATDPAKFALVDNAVPASGAQTFLELADVPEAKWQPVFGGGPPYKDSIKGNAVMYGATDKLWPGIVDDPNFSFWATAQPQEVRGLTWIANWAIGEGSHDDATVEAMNEDFPAVFFPLTPGIYKVNFQYAVTSSGGLTGLTEFRMRARHSSQWPSPHVERRKAKHFYFDDTGEDPPPPLQQAMVSWEDDAPGAPGVDEGQMMVVIPGNDGGIFFTAEQISGFSFMCRPTVSVSRIN